MVRSDLYFGLSRRDGGLVTEAQWHKFVDEVVTPRFPDGLTTIAGEGQYRFAGSDRIVHEPSRVVTVVHGGTVAEETRLGEIAAEYRQRFDQESVLQVNVPACVAFP